MKYTKIRAPESLKYAPDGEHTWVITEKLDGSQVRFWVDMHGILHVGSKRVDDTQDKMFAPVVKFLQEYVDANGLPEGYYFFGEYMRAQKHNVIQYDRLPENGIYVFDIYVAKNENRWMPPEEIEFFLKDQGLPFSPPNIMGVKRGTFRDAVQEAIQLVQSNPASAFGPIVEGVVVKTYDHMVESPYHEGFLYPFMFKVVRENFKEELKREWGQGPIADFIKSRFNLEAVHRKVFQTARDAGLLTYTMKDIPVLLQVLGQELDEEYKEAIMEFLWKKYRREAFRWLSAGLPERYKAWLYAQLMDRIDVTNTKREDNHEGAP